MNRKITNDERAALTVLQSTGIDVLEAALVAKAALKAGRGRVQRTMKCIAAGAETLKQQELTISFEKAVGAALEARKERRKRTVYDFRYFTRRFMKQCPELAKRRVRAITPRECAQFIEKAFNTPRQRQKARLILSGVFTTALKRGWCDTNPVSKVEPPRIAEKQIPILTAQEINSILQAAGNYREGCCEAAVGMMLYAGIRPHEITRLTWAQVSLPERAIYILPRHSKTGGARRVTIYKPLLHILQGRVLADSSTICPPNWQHHWREVRRIAGWGAPAHPWPQDTLRHTFASYHLSHFRSYAELQCEIGHRNASLLRTRYIDQRAVVNAAQFWNATE